MMIRNGAFALLGFFLSINQGVTLVLGTLRDGSLRGSDVFMPVDIFLYFLLFSKADQSRRTRYRNLALFAKISLLVFLLLTLVGYFISWEPAQYLFKLVHLLRALLICYCLMTRLSTVEEVKQLVNGLLAGLAFQSVIGFWQWQIGPVFLPFFNIENTWRVTGTIPAANAFGAYLLTLLPLCLRMSFFTKMRVRYLWLAISVLAVSCLLATYTRGAWVAFVVVMAIFFFYDVIKNKLNNRQFVSVMFLGVIFIAFLAIKYGHVISERMMSSKEAFVSEKKHSRVGLAKDALRIISEHKLIGVSLDNYRYYASEDIQGLQIVHNTYLLIAAEQGIPATLIFIGFYLYVLWRGFRILKSINPFLYQVGSATLSSLMALLIYNFVAPDYRLQEVLLQHWRLPGMLMGLLIVDELQKKKLLAMMTRKQQHGNTSDPKLHKIK